MRPPYTQVCKLRRTLLLYDYNIKEDLEILIHKAGGTGGVPIFKLSGGEISASKFFVDAQGQITASAGEIGGFILSSTQINDSKISEVKI